MKPNYVYVASSWRNPLQTAVCAALRSVKIPHYDFKNPTPNNHGFHWSEVLPSYQRNDSNQLCETSEYIEGLNNPIAIDGFARDYDAMKQADTCILILPCGRSAHLEMGWFVGTNKRTAILLGGPLVTPELMYKMVDYLAPSLFDLLGWLDVED